MQFEVGDVVKYINPKNNAPDDVDKEYSIQYVDLPWKRYFLLRENKGTTIDVDGIKYGWEARDEQLILIKSNKKTMSNLKEKFITAFLSEPEKTYRKAGITNGDGIITEEGTELLLTYLLKKNPEFKTEVVDVLLEECKEGKCSK